MMLKESPRDIQWEILENLTLGMLIAIRIWCGRIETMIKRVAWNKRELDTADIVNKGKLINGRIIRLIKELGKNVRIFSTNISDYEGYGGWRMIRKLIRQLDLEEININDDYIFADEPNSPNEVIAKIPRMTVYGKEVRSLAEKPDYAEDFRKWNGISPTHYTQMEGLIGESGMEWLFTPNLKKVKLENVSLGPTTNMETARNIEEMEIYHTGGNMSTENLEMTAWVLSNA